MKNRNTLQRRLVLETVRRMRNHPTAEEIYLAIAAAKQLFIGISSCSRNREKACGFPFQTERIDSIFMLHHTTTSSVGFVIRYLMWICHTKVTFVTK